MSTLENYLMNQFPVTHSPLLLPALSSLGLYLLYRRLSQKKTNQCLPLPPGPKGKPIIRNLLDLPWENQWETITQWRKEYGDIIYVSAVGQDIIYINSYEVAINLLEKRSSIYSDRVLSSMIELMNIEDILPLKPYSDQWRLGRRLFHQEFNNSAPLKFKGVQTKYANVLLTLLKEDPDSFVRHVKHFSSGVILEAIYGFQIKPTNDPYVKMAEDGLKIAEGMVAGAYLVDAFPILKYLPDWFPGTGFKAKAKEWGASALDSCRLPFELVSKAYNEGSVTPSFTASWLSKISNIQPGEERERYNKALQFASGSAYLAGYETTSAYLLNFVLHMVQNPEAQRNAQAELDRVIGRGRMPDYSDKENLPYMMALYKEVLRWQPAIPLGVPHATVVDDVYNGMYIPRGSVIFPNAWGMARDEKEYGPDPHAFRPERFSDSTAMDPAKYVFGFGRRICPGRHMAENSIWLAMCLVLHIFWIGKAKNEDGSEQPVEPVWKSAMSAHLLPFPCSFTERFEGAGGLIEVNE